jgi:type II secretory pathway pseudopilin PulG
MTRRRGVWIAVSCGIVVACAVLVAIISLTIAVPRLQTAKRVAMETGAVASIRALHFAQVQYNSQYGRFANTLGELGAPASGDPSAAAAALISNDLAGGEKGGYKLTMTGNAIGYQIVAVPIAFGVSGNRTFFSDQSMVIRENDGPEAATADSRELGAK